MITEKTTAIPPSHVSDELRNVDKLLRDVINTLREASDIDERTPGQLASDIDQGILDLENMILDAEFSAIKEGLRQDSPAIKQMAASYQKTIELWRLWRQFSRSVK